MSAGRTNCQKTKNIVLVLGGWCIYSVFPVDEVSQRCIAPAFNIWSNTRRARYVRLNTAESLLAARGKRWVHHCSSLLTAFQEPLHKQDAVETAFIPTNRIVGAGYFQRSRLFTKDNWQQRILHGCKEQVLKTYESYSNSKADGSHNCNYLY